LEAGVARRDWPWSALFAVTVWGGSFVATKEALGTAAEPGIAPFALVAMRFLLGGVVLLFVLLARGGALLPERIDRPRVALLGLLLAVHIGVQTYGLSFTLATHASWIVCFTSVTIALAAHFLYGQKLRGIGWLGVALAAGGVLGVTQSHDGGAGVGFGDFLQFTGCFTWAAYTLLGKRAVEGSGALRVTTAATLLAGLALVVVSAFTGLGAPMGSRELVALLYLGLLSSAAAFLAWYHSQAVHGSQRTAATLYIEPFVTSGVAVFFDEPLVLATVLGGAVVLGGVALVQRGAR